MRRVRLVLLSIALGALPPVPLASRCLSAPPDQSTVLGTALVIPQATATFATVYARRVSRMAREMKTDPALVLGRVSATFMTARPHTTRTPGVRVVCGLRLWSSAILTSRLAAWQTI
jgi:hypothetical protein